MVKKSSSDLEVFTSSLSSYFIGTDNHTTYRIFTQTKALFPDQQHVFVEDCSFNLLGFLKSRDHPASVYEGESGGFKTLKHIKGQRSAGSVQAVSQDGIFSFVHSGTHFRVFHTSWRYPGAWGPTPANAFHFVFDAVDDTAGRELVREVYDWQEALKDQIWVFSEGIWAKDSGLFKAIQLACWDEVVLEEDFVEQLKVDTTTFFASEEIYDSLNVTWKRGVLLLGPPGNGKTQTIQALLKDALAADIVCLYVKSFKGGRNEEYAIREIFEKARAQAPCVLVLEDLDAMVTDKLRSFFLNEMDGLEKNHGVLTIATSNHPEKIDDAILRRPSRFDQKYTFTLPTPSLRERFALKWLEKIKHAANFDFGDGNEAVLSKLIAEKTEDWSFAFLKELFVSFLLRRARDRSVGSKRRVQAEGKTDADVLLEQADALAVQVIRDGTIIGAAKAKENKEVEEEDTCC